MTTTIYKFMKSIDDCQSLKCMVWHVFIACGHLRDHDESNGSRLWGPSEVVESMLNNNVQRGCRNPVRRRLVCAPLVFRIGMAIGPGSFDTAIRLRAQRTKYRTGTKLMGNTIKQRFRAGLLWQYWTLTPAVMCPNGLTASAAFCLIAALLALIKVRKCPLTRGGKLMRKWESFYF